MTDDVLIRNFDKHYAERPADVPPSHDPFVIARWTPALAQAAASVLLDRVPDTGLAERTRQLIEPVARIADFWRVGPRHNGVIASVRGLSDVSGCRARLAAIPTISHLTAEALDEARL